MSWLAPGRLNRVNKASQALETTITYLEMAAPPTEVPSSPLNINAALLAAEEPPLHFYRYLYFHVGIHWNWEARLRLDDQTLQSAIHDSNCHITVLYVDGSPAGFFELQIKDDDSVDLAYFGTMPHVHGRKLGGWFLGQAIMAAWAHEPNRVTVNTCTLDHPAALPLYQKLGFTPYRQARGRVHPLTDTERAALAAHHGITAPASV